MLTSSQIARRISDGTIGIERRSPGTFHIGPSSLDLHISPEVARPTNSFSPIDVTDPDSFPEIETTEEDPIKLYPNEFALGATDERFDLNDDITAFLHGRSSIGRLGLFIENAGLVDRGFAGTLTLELFNASRHVIEVPAQTRIGQLVFYEHDAPPEGGYDGKYTDQESPTPSRLHEDFEPEK